MSKAWEKNLNYYKNYIRVSQNGGIFIHRVLLPLTGGNKSITNGTYAL